MRFHSRYSSAHGAAKGAAHRLLFHRFEGGVGVAPAANNAGDAVGRLHCTHDRFGTDEEARRKRIPMLFVLQTFRRMEILVVVLVLVVVFLHGQREKRDGVCIYM